MADLRVNVCGVPFKNPVIAASGTFGFGKEFNEIYDISVLGGISTKGLTLEPRLGNPTPRIAEGYGVILNAVGLQNPGVEEFVRDDLPFCAAKMRSSSRTSRGAPSTTMQGSAPALTGWSI